MSYLGDVLTGKRAFLILASLNLIVPASPCFDVATKHAPTIDRIKPGKTIEEAINGTADFFLGDLPVQESGARENRRTAMLNLPTAITASVPSYNLPGVTSTLQFSSDVLSKIFLGRIQKWNDPALSRLNPGVRLPDCAITLIQRTDENGGTDAWTDYLSKTSLEWRAAIGRTRALTLPISLSTQGSENIANQVKQKSYSLAFLELWAARKVHVQVGRVRNRDGFFVEATPASMFAAAQSELTLKPDDIPESLVNAPGKDAFPICNFMWITIPEHVPDPEKRHQLIAFVRWILTDGQKRSEELSYGRIPPQLVAHELQILERVQ